VRAALASGGGQGKTKQTLLRTAVFLVHTHVIARAHVAEEQRDLALLAQAAGRRASGLRVGWRRSGGAIGVGGGWLGGRRWLWCCCCGGVAALRRRRFGHVYRFSATSTP
jgi:hypothetical protein